MIQETTAPLRQRDRAWRHLGEEVFDLARNQSTYIPVETRHRLENPGREPLLIVEVLSPSTEGYDRGKKFELYRTIASFREYLLVHQDRRHVEHYSKQDDGSWLLREHSGADAVIELNRLNVRISLGDLYAIAIDL